MPKVGSHFVLTEPGPYGFPDLIRHGRVDNLGHVLVLRVFTAGNQRLWIPMSHLAAKSLLAAPKKEIEFEVATGVRPLYTVGMVDPVEMPLLNQFVCFRAISPAGRVCEFVNEKGQRILVSFSTAKYRALINSLKATLARKAVPAAAFAGREVFLVQNVPRYERQLTSQEAVEKGAKTLAYHTGIEPEKFLWVWTELAKGASPDEKHETAERLWSELGLDPRKAAHPDRSQATIEKFHRRLDPEGKVTFSSMRQCAVCGGYFGSKNGKRKICSDTCSAALAEDRRPPGYHAEFQRQKREGKRSKARRKVVLNVQRRCKFCGNIHTRKSSFCTPRCKERYAAL